MKSQKQLAAARTNGAKSKGPITSEGKAKASRNATKHGLLAETVVLEAENGELFETRVEELMEEHQPATPTEKMLVEVIAAARWRQDPIWVLQKITFNRDIASAPAALDALTPPFMLYKAPSRPAPTNHRARCQPGAF